MGKPWAGHCGCPSAEQIVQTVHSPSPILSLVHCLCPCISFWLGKIALRASEQTVQKRASYLLPFPGELAFLFQLQAVKGLESLCQDPELIALSPGTDAGVFITKCSVKCFLAHYAPDRPPPPAPRPTPTSSHWPNSWCWIHTGWVFATQTMRLVVVAARWCEWWRAGARRAKGFKANSKLLFVFVVLFCFFFGLRDSVGTGAKLGSRGSRFTDASIKQSCSDIWWTGL